MQLCKDCYVPMIGVVSFTKDKRDKFVGVLSVLVRQSM